MLGASQQQRTPATQLRSLLGKRPPLAPSPAPDADEAPAPASAAPSNGLKAAADRAAAQTRQRLPKPTKRRVLLDLLEQVESELLSDDAGHEACEPASTSLSAPCATAAGGVVRSESSRALGGDAHSRSAPAASALLAESVLDASATPPAPTTGPLADDGLCDLDDDAEALELEVGTLVMGCLQRVGGRVACSNSQSMSFVGQIQLLNGKLVCGGTSIA